VSCYLGKKQFDLYNSETGEEKTSLKGYDKSLISREDWFQALKGIKKKVQYWGGPGQKGGGFGQKETYFPGFLQLHFITDFNELTFVDLKQI
jgi:hypothetical protein